MATKSTRWTRLKAAFTKAGEMKIIQKDQFRLRPHSTEGGSAGFLLKTKLAPKGKPAEEIFMTKQELGRLLQFVRDNASTIVELTEETEALTELGCQVAWGEVWKPLPKAEPAPKPEPKPEPVVDTTDSAISSLLEDKKPSPKAEKVERKTALSDLASKYSV